MRKQPYNVLHLEKAPSLVRKRILLFHSMLRRYLLNTVQLPSLRILKCQQLNERCSIYGASFLNAEEVQRGAAHEILVCDCWYAAKLRAHIKVDAVGVRRGGLNPRCKRASYFASFHMCLFLWPSSAAIRRLWIIFLGKPACLTREDACKTAEKTIIYLDLHFST
jgi:hypothetical protein